MILVIGGISLDIVTLPNGICLRDVAGGAGWYTAHAVAQAGVSVQLYGLRPFPRLPAFSAPPLPGNALEKQDWQARLNWHDRFLWQGPEVPLADFPRLQIRHHGQGRATLESATWSSQPVSPADLPTDLTQYDWVHICGLANFQQQVQFYSACRARGARKISLGTYGKLAESARPDILALLPVLDAFFCNENEASLLFGALPASRPQSGNGLRVVSLADSGALAWSGKHCVVCAAPRIAELNPTGAGDTLCGTLLAHLTLGWQLPEALTRAIQVATAHVAELSH